MRINTDTPETGWSPVTSLQQVKKGAFMFNWSHKEVLPHCTCRKITPNHSVLSLTDSSNGETCDYCNHYVVWKPAGAYLLGDGRKLDTAQKEAFKAEQQAFFGQEYRVGS